MSRIQRSVVVALVLVAMPRFSAAQTRDWDDLADEIARRVERQVDQIARHVERQADQVARFEIRADSCEVVEQRSAAGPRGGRLRPRSRVHRGTSHGRVRIGRTGTFDLQNVQRRHLGHRRRRRRCAHRGHEAGAASQRGGGEGDPVGDRDSGAGTERPRRGAHGVSASPELVWRRGLHGVRAARCERGVAQRLRDGESHEHQRRTSGRKRQRRHHHLVPRRSSGWRRLSRETSRSPTAEADEFAASSVSGDVIVNRLKASGFDAQTVSADLRLTDVEVDHASIRSVSGDIEYAGRLARNGRYQFQSHSGDMRVTPADARGFAIEASTFSGDVRSDYALTLQARQATPVRPGTKSIRSRIVWRCRRDADAAVVQRRHRDRSKTCSWWRHPQRLASIMLLSTA